MAGLRLSMIVIRMLAPAVARQAALVIGNDGYQRSEPHAWRIKRRLRLGRGFREGGRDPMVCGIITISSICHVRGNERAAFPWRVGMTTW